MARKARRSALGIFALGSLAKGFQDARDREDDFNNKLGMMLVQSQIKKLGEQEDKEQQLLENRFKVLNLMRGHSYVDPRSGRTINVSGMPQTEAERQFPGILQSAETINTGPKKVGLIPQYADDKARADALKKANDATRSSTSLNHSLDLLENAAKNLGDFYPGPIGQTMARGQSVYGEYTKDEGFTNYNQTVDTVLGEISRGPLKQVGVLTDQDIELARNTVGKTYLPLNQKQAAIERLRSQAFNNIASALDAAGKSEEAEHYRDIAAQATNRMNRFLGFKKYLDKATAKKFLEQAGGDKVMARELAIQAGYDF